MEQILNNFKVRESELEKFDDYTKRRSLFLSWIGQADKCIRKGKKDSYYNDLFFEWTRKIENLLDGKPLEECKGRIKIKKGK